MPVIMFQTVIQAKSLIFLNEGSTKRLKYSCDGVIKHFPFLSLNYDEWNFVFGQYKTGVTKSIYLNGKAKIDCSQSIDYDLVQPIVQTGQTSMFNLGPIALFSGLHQYQYIYA